MKQHDNSTYNETLERVTDIFKALGDLNRLRIMELLSQGEASVGHISHTLNLSQSNVSHQLKLLKSVQLVTSKRQGQSMIYSLDDQHVATMLKQAIDHANHPKEGVK
ncbi:winged helix-turn-helix transcriptional regulator [Staphylococcus simiae]|uniref:ArsR/SmtB family transcription factor n=1 Tax=Staphylococcus simiae TaxID=308354 RepID=UPI001A9705EA|nr:metalloregulator ArsR/SmtB family transcription factor [Staphylococcus simiae]MBO1199144.1 winged helix-turn-helix transcriptional regulator [Staphylococcus simiae]MBO1201345.1 winged helix-turn-helix transcriptional regulator [Staphylococcus simiae]MBO1203493.1 winged helix-turn-helix transcriptional regulator [Staphylococcus simiae]MBO1211021.1 winged helix-turn-helix transcriptional regulator [Staphylococcus simiae]MBO1229699.1 winged helix-turn-helix transcriptional regulator [Staphyloc